MWMRLYTMKSKEYKGWQTLRNFKYCNRNVICSKWKLNIEMLQSRMKFIKNARFQISEEFKHGNSKRKLNKKVIKMKKNSKIKTNDINTCKWNKREKKYKKKGTIKMKIIEKRIKNKKRRNKKPSISLKHEKRSSL